MRVIDRLHLEISEHEGVLAELSRACAPALAAVVEASTAALASGRKLVFFGNGGSAADAQHLATELVVRYNTNRSALAAVALTTDSSALTAIGNDFGFDQLFSRQVEALCTQGDVVIGISTSGRSPNVIHGLQAAKLRGACAVAFTGGDGGALKDLADICLIVPSKVTARIQEMHILLGHTMCSALEETVIQWGRGR
jgi:D-sedoheptulose 7-phosphate isomerase